MAIDCCQALIKIAKSLNLHLTWLMLQSLSICAEIWVRTNWVDPFQTLLAFLGTLKACEWWAMHAYWLLSGTHQDCKRFESAFDMADAPMAFNLCRFLNNNNLRGSIPDTLGSLVNLQRVWVMSYAWLLIAVRHLSRLQKVWICIWHGWCSNHFRFVQKFGCERIEWIHSRHFWPS